MNIVQLKQGDQVVAHVDISHMTARTIDRGTTGVVIDTGLTGLFVEFNLRRSSGRKRLCRLWVSRSEITPV